MVLQVHWFATVVVLASERLPRIYLRLRLLSRWWCIHCRACRISAPQHAAQAQHATCLPARALQGTHSGEGATNCAIASAPGVPLFRQALDMVQHRTLTTDAWTKVCSNTPFLATTVSCKRSARFTAAASLQSPLALQCAHSRIASTLVRRTADHPAHWARPADRLCTVGGREAPQCDLALPRADGA